MSVSLSAVLFLPPYSAPGDPPGGASGKEPDMPTNTGNIRDMVHFLGWEDPMEKSMANHSNILAWRIPWTEGSIGLQSMGLQRVGHN